MRFPDSWTGKSIEYIVMDQGRYYHIVIVAWSLTEVRGMLQELNHEDKDAGLLINNEKTNLITNGTRGAIIIDNIN